MYSFVDLFVPLSSNCLNCNVLNLLTQWCDSAVHTCFNFIIELQIKNMVDDPWSSTLLFTEKSSGAERVWGRIELHLVAFTGLGVNTTTGLPFPHPRYLCPDPLFNYALTRRPTLEMVGAWLFIATRREASGSLDPPLPSHSLPSVIDASRVYSNQTRDHIAIPFCVTDLYE